MTGLILMGSIGVYAGPVRQRVPVVATMFSAVDRPEDRPYLSAVKN
jgi:hypothetical protein